MVPPKGEEKAKHAPVDGWLSLTLMNHSQSKQAGLAKIIRRENTLLLPAVAFRT